MAFRGLPRPILALVGSLAFTLPSSAEVVIIGNRELSATSITIEQARAIWLDQTKALPGGERVTAVDLDEGHPARAEFYEKVVKKTPKQLRAYWAKRAFSDAALPPTEFPNEAAVKAWVVKNPRGIAYVNASAVDNTVKVLLRIASPTSRFELPAEAWAVGGARQ